MHGRLRAPQPLLFTSGNVSENFKRFKRQYELYVYASGLHKETDDKVLASTLLHLMGEDAIEIWNSFGVEEFTVSNIWSQFEKYCIPKTNVTYERYKFFTCERKEGENIDSYLNSLRLRAKECEFGELTDSLIRDRIICTAIPQLRERLLREDLTLEKTLDMCRAAETTKVRSKEMEGTATGMSVDVNVIRKTKNGNASIKKAPKTESACDFCGWFHDKVKSKCPAYGKVCRKCKGKNHFANVCKSDASKYVHEMSHDNVEDDTSHLYVEPIWIDDVPSNDEWIVPITVNNSVIQMKVDTGSPVNLLPEGFFKCLRNKPRLHPVKMSIKSYMGENIPCVGKCVLNVETNAGNIIQLMFIVVRRDVKRQPILGLPACEKLRLIARSHDVGSLKIESSGYEQVKVEYSDVFQGLGLIPGEVSINIDTDVKPVVHAVRKVPFGLQEKLKKELCRMENLGVIERIDQPTDWVSSLVIVEKRNGSLRICLDPRDLNRAIKREHFSLPTREQIMAQFAGAAIFSKLDASQGFWQLKLSNESSDLCTFNTPFGRYRFLRLPFGVSCAPEIYHKRIHMMFEHIQGVDTSMDDIIVWGSTQEEHDQRLKEVLDIARRNNLKLNRDKCEFGVKELTFLGDVLSIEGCKPDPIKTSAIINMPRPENKKDIQRFLGMINYLGKFIGDLSTITAPLRELVEEKHEFVWAKPQEDAFVHLKSILAGETVLAFFDPRKPTKISADASQFGLGAVLLQEGEGLWKPVAYASRALSDAEKRYAQIEKELLAIVFACERFYQFIYGQKFVAETDHKPLISIMRKSLNDCPMRIQRLLLRLQKYDVELVYTPGKLMYTADTLSRAVDPSFKPDQQTSVEAFVDMIVEAIAVSPEKMAVIRDESARDKSLSVLKSVVLNGWPDVKSNCPVEVHEYWNCRSELSVVDGILFKGSRVIIPRALRKMMLNKIHEGHLGEEKCKKRAREVLYWPNMNSDISAVVSSCSICLHFRDNQPQESLNPHPVETRPYSKVGVDICEYAGKSYLVIVDYYSSYPEIALLTRINSSAVIDALKSCFARHGIPETVFSDNATQFSSREFADFATDWEFTHETSSPHFPQSNGKAENAVKTVKNLIKKSLKANSDVMKALLVYRSTPLECGKSPAQLLMGRRIRSNLPVASELLETHDSKETVRHRAFSQAKQKWYHDRCHGNELPELKPGDSVRVKDYTTARWATTGTVQNQIANRSYTVQTENGSTLRRNRRDLLKSDIRTDTRDIRPELIDSDDNSDKTDQAAEAEFIPRRSERTRKKPQRLIEEV